MTDFIGNILFFILLVILTPFYFLAIWLHTDFREACAEVKLRWQDAMHPR